MSHLFALRQAVLEDLEPRILFSADNPAGLLAATLQPQDAPEQHASVAPAQQDSAATQELVFIDARAPDADALFANIAAQAAAGRPIEAFLLSADRDGIDQISAVLAGRDDVTAIHVLAHGNEGAMRLGASWLDADTLLTHAGDIAAWGGHLGGDADLMLYGCSFAAEPEGVALVADLAQLTGADVAASTDATGATALGGDWTLEAATGAIDSAVAIDAAGQAGYAQVLNTYIVTTTANSGAGSLRQAITDANANAGADTISFNIAGTGVHTITLTTALPTIDGTVSLDASTDDSFAANGNRPAVILDGGNGNFNGLELSANADGSTIRGLVIRNFKGAGIQIDSGSDGNTVAGNYIGQMDASGTVAGSGNDGDGIFVLGAGNVIGGTTVADRNVVSGNSFGVELNGAAATGNQVIGNYIGLDATGLATLGNASRGVGVFNGASGNTIGGSSTAERNLIAGNTNDAINIDGEASDANIVRGNWIGIGSDGSTLLGNGADGIFISNGADNTQVGGAGANDGNWIAGVNFVGIELDGAITGTVIQGNRIGTDLAGTANWGAGQNGILIENTFGGAGPSANSITDNTIAFSGQNYIVSYRAGIRISDTAGTANTISANSIYSSIDMGIDLRGNGVTANDAGDADTGANNLQNFPVLTLAKTDASNQVTVAGTLNSTANSYYRIEFFASPAADGTGHGQGQIYLGFANVATNGSGNATISATLSGVAVPVGHVISATATASNATYTTFTDTSEFAKNVVSIASVQATIVVDTANDTLDGDTTSLSTLLASKGADGFVSLREAITAANNTANGTGGADRITFQIAGTGVHTITLASALPSIAGPVILDASTDDSVAANAGRPAIVIDGNNGAFNLLTLDNGSGGSTIRGFVLTNTQQRGVLLSPGSDGNTIAGNYIGRLTAAGTQAATTNGLWGISVLSNGNLIGGTSAADRNVVSGNGIYGIYFGGTQNNQVLGNYFGSDAAGNDVITTVDYAVVLDNGSTGNVIGGAGTAGNLFVGKGAVWIFGENSDGNTVQGNQIGLAADGTTVRGITGYGIRIQNGGDNNIIGGAGSLGNVLLGVNGTAVELYGDISGSVLQGNYIGIDRTLTVTGTNTSNIVMEAGAHDNLIGGVNAGEGNYSTASNGSGIHLSSTAGVNNVLLRNLVWNTSQAGLDLQGGTQSGTGATANDVGDADTGPNNLQNFPVLSLAKTNGSSQIDIRGTLNSNASSFFRLEFFAKPADGSSASYLGFVNVATDGAGNANFATVLAATVPVGSIVTATATRADASYSTFTDTSEFAATLDAGATPVHTAPATATFTEDVTGAIAGLSVVDGGVLAMTTSLGVLQGTLAVSLAGGATISAGASNSAALTLSGTAAQVNAALATLTYRGAGNFAGSDTLTIVSTDASTLVDTDTVAITVTAVNDAPVLGAIAPVLATITEDQTANAGQTVASFIGPSIADADSGAVQGIAITSAVSGTGAWQFSIDAGSSWAALGAVSDSASRLLRATDLIRFVPDGANATSGSITYRAWDQSSGSAGTTADTGNTGGATAFSVASDTATLAITAVNDAPVLTPAAPVLTPITEDQTANAGQTVGSFIGASITDADGGGLQGIALTALTPGNGSWQFSIDGGASWADPGALSDTGALLLRSTDLLRLVPNGETATAGSLTYRAWDRTIGSAGALIDVSVHGGSTAFSSATDTASIAVTAVNDAPVLVAIAPTLAPITEDEIVNAGQTVASFVGGSIVDADGGGTPGIAITGLVSGSGSWQFSTDGGASWSNVGAVSDASALLLRATDSVRFVPDGANATAGSLTYRAWDQASGTAGSLADASLGGGTSAFSIGTDTASIAVSAVADAPVLVPVSPVLATLAETDIANGGQAVASFIGSSIVSVDSGALQGIAIVGTDAGNGAWQFSIDGGVTWTAIGPVADSAALLLRPTDAIRFVPDGANGTTGSVTYRAWDQTVGAAGSTRDASTPGDTAFSTATDTATLTVTDVADAPVIGGSTTAYDVAENSSVVTTLTGSDVDQSTTALTWSIVGGADAARFAIDAATGALRFVVAPDAEAPFAAGGGQVHGVVVQVSDGTLIDTRALTVTVTPVDDNAPVFTSHSGSGGAPARIDVASGVTAVARLQAVDNDLPTPDLAYAIAGGDDASQFTLDAATGELAFIVAPPGASALRLYDVVVQASDGGQATLQRLSIAVAPAAVPVTPPATVPVAPPPVDEPVAPPSEAPETPPATAPVVPQDVVASSAAATTSTAAPAQTAASPASSAQPVASAARPATVERSAVPSPGDPSGLPAAGERAVDASLARTIELAPVRPLEPPLRTGVAITLPSHRVDVDIAWRALDPLVTGALNGQAGKGEHYSAATVSALAESPPGDDPVTVATTLTVSLALSIGVIGWASRGAALVASVLVASPAWRSYDLLPVLKRCDEDADWGDGDPLAGTPLGDTDLAPLDASAETTRRDHDILELH